MKPEPVSEAASEAWGLLLYPPVAHRGLWSSKGPPENSRAAFAAAANAGYGVELDVRLSADGEAMVFHDEGLERMARRQGPLGDHTARELAAMRLNDTGQPIPTLREVLEDMDGRAFVHVELKTRLGEEGPLDTAVADVLDSYAGPIAVIGFNPGSHAWWAEHRPQVLRGLGCKEPGRLDKDMAAARPHFLTLAAHMLGSEPAQRAREDGFPVLAWTIRSAAEAVEVAPLCDNLMFEGFRP